MSHATLLKALVLTPKHTHTHRACVQNLQNRCATPSLRQHAYATMRNHMHRTGMPTQLMHSHIHQASTHTPQMRSRMQWINTLTTNSQSPETSQMLTQPNRTRSPRPACLRNKCAVTCTGPACLRNKCAVTCTEPTCLRNKCAVACTGPTCLRNKCAVTCTEPTAYSKMLAQHSHQHPTFVQSHHCESNSLAPAQTNG